MAAHDVITSDREVEAHRSSPPTPEPQVPKYEVFRVQDGIAVPDHAILSPDVKVKRRFVYDSLRGEYVEMNAPAAEQERKDE